MKRKRKRAHVKVMDISIYMYIYRSECDVGNVHIVQSCGKQNACAKFEHDKNERNGCMYVCEFVK